MKMILLFTQVMGTIKIDLNVLTYIAIQEYLCVTMLVKDQHLMRYSIQKEVFLILQMRLEKLIGKNMIVMNYF